MNRPTLKKGGWTWTPLLLAAAAFICAGLAHPSYAAQCGATERWFVKVGTDPEANLVRLDQIIPNTVQGMNQLPKLQPTVPAGNKVRISAERVVYQVSGFVVMFKREPDTDYHLVITDDSLRYTPGGPGTDGLETGTSFIAEIPDPNCVAGTQGDPNVPSLFAAQLSDVRSKFEARFPGGAGADTNLGGIPVTLVGIAFYDRPHRQTGRAVNGIELHPLLDIRFEGAAPPGGVVTPPVSPNEEEGGVTQLLANSSFEDGVTGWSGTVDDIGSFQDQQARAGSKFAWMGSFGTAHSESLYQNVSIPASVQSVMLSFWLRISTNEVTTTKAHDKLYVQVRDKDGHVLKTLATYSNLDATGDWVQKTFDVSAFIDKDVQIFFKMIEDQGKATSFQIDDVTLTAD